MQTPEQPQQPSAPEHFSPTAYVAEPALPNNEPMPAHAVEYHADSDADTSRLAAITAIVGTPAVVMATEMVQDTSSSQPWVEAAMNGTEGGGLLLGAISMGAAVVYRARARRGWNEAAMLRSASTA